MRRIAAAILVLACAFGLRAAPLAEADWAGKRLGLAPERYAEGRTGRRTVDWYRHTGDPAWGDPQTNAVDRFSVVKPVAGDRTGAPLLVVLHWRGAGWPGKGVDLQTSRSDEKGMNFSAPDDFYILNLDDIRNYHVLWNRTHDQYWWGATPNYGGPTVADVPRLMKGETPCERRVMDTVEWTVRRYGIDRNRVYLCGNSMGGQAAYAIGLAHGEVFASVNANVPATAWYAAARLGFVNAAGRDVRCWPAGRFADPPVCVEWSGTDDMWSRDREVIIRNLARRKWPHLVLWGDFGHCGSVDEARRRNELVERFDWLSVRRDAAYPVFTGASCDDALPWPFSEWKPRVGRFSGWKGDIGSAEMKIAEGARPCGQINAFFRWRNVRDGGGVCELELRLTDAEELGAVRLLPPAEATADVTVRRIQDRDLAGASCVRWRFGAQGGTAVRDGRGCLTLPGLVLTRKPEILHLEKIPSCQEARSFGILTEFSSHKSATLAQ